MKFRLLKVFLIKILAYIPARISGFATQILRESQGFGLDFGLRNEIRALKKIVQKKNISVELVLDIGANIGNWSTSFQAQFPESKIIAF